MKKLLVLSAVILLGTPATSPAQAPSFGIRGGLNMSAFGGQRIIDSGYRAGLDLGAYLSIPVSATVAIQPEVLFSQKGANHARYDEEGVPLDIAGPPISGYLRNRTSHDYLEIPVLLKVSAAPPGDCARPIFFAGPSVGFLLGAKEVYETDYEVHLESTEFAVILGGGVELGRLSLEARYHLGLSTIDKGYEDFWGSIPATIKNRGFAVMVGFRLF